MSEVKKQNPQHFRDAGNGIMSLGLRPVMPTVRATLRCRFLRHIPRRTFQKQRCAIEDLIQNL